MKRILTLILALCMIMGLFAGCEPQPTEPSQPSDLENAKTYLFKMYNTAGKDEENKFLADKDVTSAQTFDAGIALYVGVSVLGAVGTVALGKKRED